VALGANVVVAFSEQVKGVKGATFTLTNLRNGKKVTATVTLSADGRTATLNPSAKLADGRAYRVNLTNGIHDVAGNGLAALSWRFHT
jgi:hypothetical protein